MRKRTLDKVNLVCLTKIQRALHDKLNVICTQNSLTNTRKESLSVGWYPYKRYNNYQIPTRNTFFINKLTFRPHTAVFLRAIQQYERTCVSVYVIYQVGGAEFCQLISTSAMASSSLQQLSLHLCLEAYLVLPVKYAVLL